MNQPFDGQAMGCRDTAPPEDFSEHELSRFCDDLFTAYQLGGEAERQKLWVKADYRLRAEFIYSKWYYRAAKVHKHVFKRLDDEYDDGLIRVWSCFGCGAWKRVRHTTNELGQVWLETTIAEPVRD